MKKKIISIAAVFIIIFIFLCYRFFSVYSLYAELVNLPESDYDGRIKIENNDDNFPNYFVKFMADNEKRNKIFDTPRWSGCAARRPS